MLTMCLKASKYIYIFFFSFKKYFPLHRQKITQASSWIIVMVFICMHLHAFLNTFIWHFMLYLTIANYLLLFPVFYLIANIIQKSSYLQNSLSSKIHSELDKTDSTSVVLMHGMSFKISLYYRHFTYTPHLLGNFHADQPRTV